MQRGYRRYSTIGHRQVKGWVEPGILQLIAALSAEQARQNVTGGIVEIGVHHGRFLIGLHLLGQNGEPTVAIDLFEDQAANVFHSGLGDQGILRRNLAKHVGDVRAVKIIQADSTTLDGDGVKGLASSAVRLFSVDGGHTADIVAHDMETAADSITTGGIVIADDVFNARWPEVYEGTLRFLDKNYELVPFAVGFNKVLFTSRAEAAGYRSVVEDTSRRNIWKCKGTVMHGEPVIACWIPPARQRGRLAAKRLLRR
jgi:hypothetical protein